MSQYVYRTTDQYGDAFEIEWDETEQRYYVTVHDKAPRKGPVEAVSSLTAAQMRDAVLAVGTHIQEREAL